MLQLKNVSKYYYSKGVVASGFVKANLELRRGEFVAITGESGSGKSTLLNVLSGLDSYEEGVMYVEGEDTSGYSEIEWEKYRRKFVSNIFQSFNLIPSYTVYQNVELALLLNGCKGKNNKEIVLEALRKVGLYEFRNQRASRLSGGQKQRVAIARALVRDTPVIVADEPTGNLDTASAQTVVELLSRVAEDKLVIVVTHNYDQVKEYVTRKITMHDGQIVEDINLRPLRRSVAFQEKESLGVYDAVMQKIGFGQTARLGVRNAFNIFPKFILLLLVFLFACLATASYFSSTQNSIANSLDYRMNYYFQDLSANRIIVKKTNGSAISASDLEKLAGLSRVSKVVKDDLYLDTTVYLEGNNMSIDGRIVALDTFHGSLDAGRMPKADNEVVAVLSENGWYGYGDSAENMLNDVFSVIDAATWSKTGSDNIVVSGIMFVDNYDYIATLYCSDKLIDNLRGHINANYSTITVEMGKLVHDTQRWDTYLQITPGAKVKKGSAYIAKSYVSDAFEPEASELEDEKFYEPDPVGKTVKATTKNLYYSSETTFTIAGTYDESNFAELSGRATEEYEYSVGIILVNEEDYRSMFASDTYQSSVFAESEEAVPAVAENLQALGYETLCIRDVTVNYVEVLEKVESFLYSIRTVIILIAIFFISYFVIRLIMKSRNSYFSTVRILGATKKDCYRLIFLELLTVLTVAYLILMLLVLLDGVGVIQFDIFDMMVSYFTVTRTVVLFIVLGVMCYLIANRYSRKLFKKSAMNTYKEA